MSGGGAEGRTWLIIIHSPGPEFSSATLRSAFIDDKEEHICSVADQQASLEMAQPLPPRGWGC